ncbi:HdeD family acid-resistance protein [Cupriavidus sp. 30B13]|uniref:HdeD family acid-resistance protein n=1 Tax=Cupriavidus sp. 30B13 TaxID=3384241 RepID=UPI003B8FBD0B
MLHYYAKLWWVVGLRGVFALLFGICAFFAPIATLAALVLVFGAFAAADGVTALAMAISGSQREASDRGILALQGLLGLGVGLLTWFSPVVTAFSLLLYIAAWTLATGVLQIVAAIRLRKDIPNEWWLVLAGAVSIVFAFLLLWQPLAGALALLWMIGAWALVCGVLLIGVALRLRSARHVASTPLPG